VVITAQLDQEGCPADDRGSQLAGHEMNADAQLPRSSEMLRASGSLPKAAINDVAIALPAQVLTNDELLEGLSKNQRILLVRHTGVLRRHVAAADQTALDLGEDACRKLFAAHPQLQEQIDTLIFCTQSADHILPPNACILHGRLGLHASVAAFDLPHACSAFVYAIHLARGLVACGSAHHVLVVTADTYSKFIHPLDRSTRLVFGDGAAATWISATTDDRGVLDVMCGTAGALYDKFLIPAGGCRQLLSDSVRNQEQRDGSGNVRSPANIQMMGHDILSFVTSRIPDHVNALLARNALSLHAVDWIVFHQASSVVLDTLTKQLGADPAKVFRHLEMVGNTVSASIPVALRAAMDSELIKPGQLVLLCGFGAGLSWGSALVRW
jgi:3-oxoacyl-[acyl-carrier-protein] synthase-3